MLKDLIGRIIREHRLAAGLTLKELADMIDMNWRQVQRWEHGESVPRHDAMERVAAVLDIDESEFMLGQRYDDPQEALQAQVSELRNLVATLQAQVHTLTAKRDKGQIKDVPPMVPAATVQDILREHDIGPTALARNMGWKVKTTGQPDPTHAGRQVGWYGSPPRVEIEAELARRILECCDIDPQELERRGASNGS